MRPSTKKWLLALLSLAVLFAATTRIEPLAAQRKAYQLSLPPLPDEMAPSMLYTPMLALGRAPLVDILWIRATKLKEAGRYFDALQLSQRICELQPKFAAVWAFQAWNMSYNISVTLKTPEERWRWVRNGFELLRDKGIPLNPNNTQLYRELAWIFFHKVGDFMDDWHYYYKLQFALLNEDILGEPPEGFVGPGRVRGDYYRNYDYRPLAEAPSTVEALLEQSSVADFVERLKPFGFDATENGIFLGLLSSMRKGKIVIPETPDYEQEEREAALLELMRDPETAAARRALEYFWRAHRLRTEMKLDPARIVRLQEGLGVSLDYRLAESHALYWANLGIEMGTDKREVVDIHKLNTNRIEFYCLQKMFHRGRMAMSPNSDLGEPPLLNPDMRVVPMLRKAFERDSKKYLDFERKPDKAVSENFKTGYVGFMRSAILRFHELGRNDEAKEMLDALSKAYPDPIYKGGLDGFIARQMVPDRELQDFRSTRARIEALIGRGLVRYGYDEDEEAVRYIARARQIYQMYQKNAVSKRQRFPDRFSDIVSSLTHKIVGQMYRGTYVRVCGKLGIEPLPEREPDEPKSPAESG